MRRRSRGRQLELTVTENQALFALDDVWVATRLIDGQFPNYRQLLPESFDHAVELTAKRSLGGGAPRRACWPRRTRLSGSSSRRASSRMRAVTQDVGQAEESSTSHTSGDEFEIGFNPASSSTGSTASTATRSTLKFISPLRPACSAGRTELPLSDHADPPQQLRRPLRDGRTACRRRTGVTCATSRSQGPSPWARSSS